MAAILGQEMPAADEKSPQSLKSQAETTVPEDGKAIFSSCANPVQEASLRFSGMLF